MAEYSPCRHFSGLTQGSTTIWKCYTFDIWRIFAENQVLICRKSYNLTIIHRRTANHFPCLLLSLHIYI